MPTIKFKLTGVEETQQAFDRLTPELVAETAPMQQDVAEAAAATIRGLYAYKTGALVAGVRTRRVATGGVRAAYVVENINPLASIYDHGTMTVRETAEGYARGRMPARPVFTRTTNDAHREADTRLVQILRAHGLTVTYATD